MENKFFRVSNKVIFYFRSGYRFRILLYFGGNLIEEGIIVGKKIWNEFVKVLIFLCLIYCCYIIVIGRIGSDNKNKRMWKLVF